MSVMCLSDGSHWPATTAEYQKKKKKKKYSEHIQNSTGYVLDCWPKCPEILL